ncbi:MAG TPA: dTDP-4-dehydrorhamnose 3,5-epimerase family protein [Mycobacteriales bacterium]|jgi:dTDP-4-dehydrorhamnose 3,5-epimerase|nr:dTDP-4-dehydrorhamnose 3,5-epimerase family protein [Mycobacteriales bacterium]
MEFTETKVPGAWTVTPRPHADDRGVFLEMYKAATFAPAIGHPLSIAQVNNSVSRRNVLRGIHFALVPPGQAKFVYCPSGAGLDFVIDIRDGSPTFGTWDVVRIDSSERRGVYIAEGIGHAFVALSDEASLLYFCSAEYDPAREFTVSPFDPELDIDWQVADPILSDRDRDAPTLKEARELGQLPTWESALARYAELGLRLPSADPAGGA